MDREIRKKTHVISLSTSILFNFLFHLDIYVKVFVCEMFQSIDFYSQVKNLIRQ